MHPDLMHSSSERPAKHHTCCPIKTQTFEFRLTFLPLWGHLANTNLIADNLNWLRALSKTSVNVKSNVIIRIEGLYIAFILTLLSDNQY